MTIIEIDEGNAAATRNVALAQQQTSVADRIRQIWPLYVVGLGLVATCAWMALLGWMLYRAVLVLA